MAKPTEKATHRCKVCGAGWILHPPSFPNHCGPNGCGWCKNASWSVVDPELMGDCCDNAVMGEQIEKLEGSP